MFKREGSLECYLFVNPDTWVIRDANTEMELKSGPSGQICPAHPSNFSTSKPDLDLNIWEFNKADENQEEKFEEGVVLLRCSIHDASHAQWLVEQVREGQLEKGKVAALLCEEDDKGSVLFSLLDKDVQQEVSPWNKKRTNKIAHLLSSECVQWIVQQALEDNWDKEDVGSIVCRKNRDNRLILATMDEETQKHVAIFNQEKTISAVPYMDTDFLQWLYQEAVEGRWNQSKVFAAVVKEELDGNASFSPRIKPGKSIVNFLSCPMISTHL